MPNNVDHFFEKIILLLKNNKITEIVNLCAFPLPVYMRGKIMLVGTPENSKDAIKNFRASLVKAGWTHSDLRVIAQSMVDENQLSVWVETKHFDANEKIVADSTTRYFCTLEGGNISKIEMLEYLDAPPKEVTKEWPVPYS